MKDFCDLPIWRQGYDLLMGIYDVVENFPRDEKYALVDQLLRAANSIIANIAESHGRYYYADKVRVLYIARGEILEARSHLSVARGRKYITEKQFAAFDQAYCQLTKNLNLYINSLLDRKQQS
ncbi:MAG: four helix bundle protein [Patescibacteria group bacterium]